MMQIDRPLPKQTQQRKTRWQKTWPVLVLILAGDIVMFAPSCHFFYNLNRSEQIEAAYNRGRADELKRHSQTIQFTVDPVKYTKALEKEREKWPVKPNKRQ